MEKNRKIIHIDMDCFYAAVEMRDNPEYQNIPIAVGGNSNRGVLCTCNYLAREYGVRSAMPNHQAKKLCPDLLIVNGRMEVYQQVSQQIREIFQRYTHLIEPLSLDEAYLDVTGSSQFHGSATLIGQQIRADIFNELQLTASAGIAPNKFLAKIASDENKPNGQCVITPEEVIPFVEKLDLKRISGVGKVTSKKLNSIGLYTGQDVRYSNIAFLTQHLGSYGGVLWSRCQGVDERNVDTSRIRKSVGVERTFDEDISDIEQLKQIINYKLIPELISRSKKYLGTRIISKLGVKVKFADFIQTTKESKHASFDEEVFDALLELAIERGGGKAVRLLGVHIGLDDVSDVFVEQLEMFG